MENWERVRLSRDEYFMEVCRAIAKRATCDRWRSGCVIARANQILVISDGKIAERGKHEDLILADGIYKRLFDIYKKTNIWQMDIEGSENEW